MHSWLVMGSTQDDYAAIELHMEIPQFPHYLAAMYATMSIKPEVAITTVTVGMHDHTNTQCIYHMTS